MLSITFDDLADYVKHGREIEFRYEGKEYSITNSHYKWHFCCDTDGTIITLCDFSEFEVLVEKISRLEINSISITKIFNEHLGGVDVLAVL